jgi:CubicO group peptidase (beta-lactamase class C family)
MRPGAPRRTAVLAVATLVVGTVTLTSAAGSTAVEHLSVEHPSKTLRDGTPKQAGLVAGPIEQMATDLRSFLAPSPTKPMYAGGVVLAGHNGYVVQRAAAGYALRYADGEGTELPKDQWIPARTDTIYDLASVSKLFTSIALVQQVEAGRIDLDRTVASYIPAFAANGKEAVTVRHLLTHTSGFPARLPQYSSQPTPEARIQAVYDAKLSNAPGSTYLYSDLNMITAGKLVELVTGKSLDKVVHDGITGPLHMSDTGYNPPASELGRIAATEYQTTPARGMVHGSVHDENAWALNGVAGHAGVFSTADDLAILAQTIVNGGSYGKARVLSPTSVDTLLHNENEEFPANSHGLGFELNQMFYMDALSSPTTAGHTGYTGTSIVIDRESRSFVILLTNRVHPSRNWGSNNVARRAVARDMAMAIPVRPRHGPTAWFSGVGDARTATLTVPVKLGAAPSRLTFDLWYDTEKTDVVTLEASTDGGETWQELKRWSGWSGKKWGKASVDLDGLTGDVALRWRYTSDSLYQGRGVYVDGIRVTSRGHTVFDDSRPRDADAVQPAGWSAAKS